MQDPELQARLLRVAETCRRHNIGQMQIAAAVGASQSQVSRIIGGRGQRLTRLTEEVCLYVERLASGGVTVDAVRQNDQLIESLRETWDGSSAHAHALSAVIRSLAALGAVRGQSPASSEDHS
ncbi:hypothetical protein [Metallibacterium sp.]